MAKPPLPPICSTGIEDLDLILRGGLPRGSLTLLCGGMGSGRTSLCYEFLKRGVPLGEKGALLSSMPKKVYQERIPDFDFAGEKPFDGITLVDFVPEDHSDPETFVQFIEELVKRINSGRAKRIVVDSMEQMLQWLPSAVVSRGMRQLQEAAFRKKVCLIVTAGVMDDAEMHPADVVIDLGMRPVGPDAMRTLEVMRLRGEMQPLSVYVLSLGKEGALLTRLMEGQDD